MAKPTKTAAEKKTTAKEEAQEKRADVVGTAADPKPPEAGSIGTDNGGKKVVDDLSEENTNVREGASVADGNERIAMLDGTVGTRDDLPAGSTIIGEEGTANGTALDREPTPVTDGSVQPSELNPSPTTDPIINGLFDPNQAPAPKEANFVEPGTTVGDEAPGFTPEDERYIGVDTEQLVGLKAAVDRVETARKHGHNQTAHEALDALKEALAPIDAGAASKIREWADKQRDDLVKDEEKAAKKAERAANKADKKK